MTCDGKLHRPLTPDERDLPIVRETLPLIRTLRDWDPRFAESEAQVRQECPDWDEYSIGVVALVLLQLTEMSEWEATHRHANPGLDHVQ